MVHQTVFLFPTDQILHEKIHSRMSLDMGQHLLGVVTFAYQKSPFAHIGLDNGRPLNNTLVHLSQNALFPSFLARDEYGIWIYSGWQVPVDIDLGFTQQAAGFDHRIGPGEKEQVARTDAIIQPDQDDREVEEPGWPEFPACPSDPLIPKVPGRGHAARFAGEEGPCGSSTDFVSTGVPLSH